MNNDLIIIVNSLTIPFLTDATHWVAFILFSFSKKCRIIIILKTRGEKMLDRLPNYIRPTVFLSAIFGLVLGILLVVPVVQLFLIFLFWIIGAVIVYMLKRNNFIGQFSQREGIIIGSISGMISVIAAAVSFIPLSMIVGAIFKTVSVSFLFTTSFMSSIFSLFVPE